MAEPSAYAPVPQCVPAVAFNLLNKSRQIPAQKTIHRKTGRPHHVSRYQGSSGPSESGHLEGR